jgi:hypothetical protein
MAMANDPPTSLGVRFGGKQAHDSGMKGFSVPTTGQMNFHLEQERDLKKLTVFLDANPELRPLAKRWSDQQKEMGTAGYRRLNHHLPSLMRSKDGCCNERSYQGQEPHTSSSLWNCRRRIK